MKHQNLTLTILGSSGGVAKAVLSILNKSIDDKIDPLHFYISHCKIHLIDWNQKEFKYFQQLFPNLHNKIILHQFDLRDTKMFQQHLSQTKTSLVIDVSWADTIEMIRCCNELGVHYINSALESTLVDENIEFEGHTLIERYRIFEENRNQFTNMKGIIGSGMNPGVVEWMAFKLIEQSPDEIPLGCYIVEMDNSFYADQSVVEKNTIYSTWSPECFLDEAILNYPMFMKNHVPLFIYNDVYELEFKVSLGNKCFYGCLMSHEEVITLGKHHDMETGFIYKVNDYTTDLIRTNLDHADDLWGWKHQVLDPADGELVGEDLVGVLLVYKDKERFMYNVMNNKFVFSQYRTNATYFQVACGIYGAISTVLLDELSPGIYLVDELLSTTDTHYGQYVTYYMKDFVIGENNGTDGLLLNRLRKFIP